jgi:hypothetical protein
LGLHFILKMFSYSNNGDGRVFYNWRELGETSFRGKMISARRHLWVLRGYEGRLRKGLEIGNFDRVDGGCPNYVISWLIAEANTQGKFERAKLLVDGFRDKGYSDMWVGKNGKI